MKGKRVPTSNKTPGCCSVQSLIAATASTGDQFGTCKMHGIKKSTYTLVEFDSGFQLHQVNLFVLLSMICVMLNVTGLILGCQGIQFVSRVSRCDLMDMDENKTCLCCEELHSTRCTEVEAVLKLYHLKSCSAAHLLLKSAEEIQEPSRRVSLSPSSASCVPAGANSRTFYPLRKRSKSDPVLLHCQLPQGTVLNCETETLNDVNPLNAVILQKSSRARALRGRPQSLIDYKSYMDTKQHVAWIFEQSSSSMSPDIHDLVENIKSVLKSDEKHMAEAVTSATFFEQVMTHAWQATSLRVHVLPFRLRHGLLYLENCGVLSTFTTEEEQLAERRIQRAEHEQLHSHIGVVRETVL